MLRQRERRTRPATRETPVRLSENLTAPVCGPVPSGSGVWLSRTGSSYLYLSTGGGRCWPLAGGSAGNDSCLEGVFLSVNTGGGAGAGSEGRVPSIDLETFGRVVREQKGLPISDEEADRLARMVEGSRDDQEFLGNALEAIRLIADRLEQSSQACCLREDIGGCPTQESLAGLTPDEHGAS